MIATFTPNPSIDRTLHVHGLVPGAVLRATRSSAEAAGKGVNVSAVLKQIGCQTTALLPIGSSGNGGFVRSLRADGIPFHALTIGGTIRTNISIVEQDGTTTKINEPGVSIADADVDDLLDEVIAAATNADLLVAAGSLPGTTSTALYQRLSGKIASAQSCLVVDTSGEALQAMVGQPCLLLKPNLQELSELVGCDLLTYGDVLDAADSIIGPASAMLISMGSGGAILRTKTDAWIARAEADVVRNTVGAGDSLLAGFLACGTMDDQALATGVAWGRAAVQSAGTRVTAPTTTDLEAVSVSGHIDRKAEPENEGH